MDIKLIKIKIRNYVGGLFLLLILLVGRILFLVIGKILGFLIFVRLVFEGFF